ncbi:MAG: zinc ribbon domain-containing protein [Candidatus Gastranaerophilales bacterium]|nr:zinc ribbon domain-containing protein [Candidatus Gastranaerophilales bacterium]
MYRNDVTGCLMSIFIALLIFFLIKELWWLIVGLVIIAVVVYYSSLIYEKVSQTVEKEKESVTPQMGEVFKVCPYCNAKVKVTTKTCPQCGRALN